MQRLFRGSNGREQICHGDERVHCVLLRSHRNFRQPCNLCGYGKWISFELVGSILFVADTQSTGISEYFFFLLSVMGLFILRRNTDSTSQYRTWTINPVTFCLVSGFLVVRGLLTDPLQGAALFTLIAIGWLIFRLRFRLIDNTGGT